MEIDTDILEKFKNWEIKVPKYIENITPMEAYLQGFDSGYKCKIAELEDKAKNFRPFFSFNLVGNSTKSKESYDG